MKKRVCVYACVREYKKQERENYEKECALVGDILVKCNYIWKQEPKRPKDGWVRISLSICRFKEHTLVSHFRQSQVWQPALILIWKLIVNNILLFPSITLAHIFGINHTLNHTYSYLYFLSLLKVGWVISI